MLELLAVFPATKDVSPDDSPLSNGHDHLRLLLRNIDTTRREMAVQDSAGAKRAMYLLMGIPDRFNEFCHMDQMTFVQLADWILNNVESQLAVNISIEESLLVFFDIVAQGNSFSSAAYGWDHDIELTQGYAKPTYCC